MAELILTKYQAQVFRDVEALLKTVGNPRGVKVNPKAYYLSKRIAVYIINNIAKNQSTAGGGTTTDVQNVYQWLFGVLPTPPITPVSNTGTPTPPTPPNTVVTNTIGLGTQFNNPASADNDNSTVSDSVFSYQGSLSAGVELTTIQVGSGLQFTAGETLFLKVISADESEYLGDVIEIESEMVGGVSIFGGTPFGGTLIVRVVRVIPSVVGNLPGNGNNNQGGTGQGSGGFIPNPV